MTTLIEMKGNDGVNERPRMHVYPLTMNRDLDLDDQVRYRYRFDSNICSSLQVHTTSNTAGRNLCLIMIGRFTCAMVTETMILS